MNEVDIERSNSPKELMKPSIIVYMPNAGRPIYEIMNGVRIIGIRSDTIWDIK